MARTLTKSATLYAATPDSHRGETRDCSVRALSVAANVPYARAHAMLARAGRKPQTGVQLYHLQRAAPCLGGVALALPAVAAPLPKERDPYFARQQRRRHTAAQRYPTLAAVLAAHPTGRLMVSGMRHVFAVIDGAAHDWASSSISARSRVDGVWIFPGAQHRPNGVQSAVNSERE